MILYIHILFVRQHIGEDYGRRRQLLPGTK